MRLNLRAARAGLVLALALAAGVFGSGCSGITASHSVSPASFFIPGLGHHQAPAAAPVAPEAPLPPAVQLAQSR